MKLGMRFMELVWHHQRPGWTTWPWEDSRERLQEFIDRAPEGWVIDGNYQQLQNIIKPHLGTAIVIHLPYWRMFWRTFKHSIKRSLTGELVAGGNRETFWQHFFTRESIFLERWQMRATYDQRPAVATSGLLPSAVVRLIESARALDEFYETYGLSRP